MSQMSAAQAERQRARHGDGKYAEFARDEADVDLDLNPPVAQGWGVDPDEPDAEQPGEPVEQATTYIFPSWKTAKAINSIEKANRRAERAGIPERFGYTIETFDRSHTDADGITHVEEMTRLTLDRPTVQHDGWQFAATLNWDDEVGLVTRTVPGADLDERPDSRTCDVCHSQRDRRDTYVVQRTDPATGERQQMQVGSNCLANFLGLRPAGLWMLDFDVDESEDAEPPTDYRHRVEERYDSRQVMAIALAAVEQGGWVSRSAAQAYAEASGGEATKTATADVVAFGLYGRPTRAEDKAAQEALRARAVEIQAAGDADELLDEARSIDGDSDYATNLRTVASGDTVTARNTGLLISAIGARYARKEREAKQAARATSKHVGVAGQKIADVQVTVESVRFFPNQYAGKTLISMRDSEGNVIKWWASGHHEGEYDEDETYTLKATVKEHGEWQGVAETTVLRAKIEPVEP